MQKKKETTERIGIGRHEVAQTRYLWELTMQYLEERGWRMSLITENNVRCKLRAGQTKVSGPRPRGFRFM